MKTKVTDSELVARIVALASDFDPYEFADSFESEENCYEHTLKMLCDAEQMQSLICFMRKTEESCTDALMDRNIEDAIINQFVQMRDEANAIRLELSRRLVDKMLLSNNRRKMAGLPLWRKKNGGRRFYTRCEADEAVGAFCDYCNCNY